MIPAAAGGPAGDPAGALASLRLGKSDSESRPGPGAPGPAKITVKPDLRRRRRGRRWARLPRRIAPLGAAGLPILARY